MPEEKTPEEKVDSEGEVKEELTEEELTEKEAEKIFNEDEDGEKKKAKVDKKDNKKSQKVDEKSKDEKLEPDKEPDEETDKDEKGEDDEEKDKDENPEKDAALEAAEKIKETQDKETEETEKKEAEKKADEEAEEFSAKAILKGADLSDQGREFATEFSEQTEILDVVVDAKIDRVYDEFNSVIAGLTKQWNENYANLSGNITLTKNVPEWEDLIFTGKKDKDDKNVERPEWLSWLKEQPDLFQLLYESKNPMDNVKLLKYYKKDIAKKSLTEAGKTKNDKLQKEKDKHGHTPAGGKTVKTKTAASGTYEEEWNNPDTEPKDE